MTAHESADGAPVEACDVRSQVTASVTTTFVLPPEAFTVVLPPPVMVSQVNVEHVFGIPQRTYLEILREPGCPIEVTPVGKLRLSETIELQRHLVARGKKAKRATRTSRPALNGDDVLPVEEQERLGIKPAPRRPTGRR